MTDHFLNLVIKNEYYCPLKKTEDLTNTFPKQKAELFKLTAEHFHTIVIKQSAWCSTIKIQELAAIFPKQKTELFKLTAKHFYPIVIKQSAWKSAIRIQHIAATFPEQKAELFKLTAEHFHTIVAENLPPYRAKEIQKLANTFPEHKAELFGLTAKQFDTVVIKNHFYWRVNRIQELAHIFPKHKAELFALTMDHHDHLLGALNTDPDQKIKVILRSVFPGIEHQQILNKPAHEIIAAWNEFKKQKCEQSKLKIKTTVGLFAQANKTLTQHNRTSLKSIPNGVQLNIATFIGDHSYITAKDAQQTAWDAYQQISPTKNEPQSI